MSHVEFYINI